MGISTEITYYRKRMTDELRRPNGTILWHGDLIALPQIHDHVYIVTGEDSEEWTPYQIVWHFPPNGGYDVTVYVE